MGLGGKLFQTNPLDMSGPCKGRARQLFRRGPWADGPGTDVALVVSDVCGNSDLFSCYRSWLSAIKQNLTSAIHEARNLSNGYDNGHHQTAQTLISSWWFLIETSPKQHCLAVSIVRWLHCRRSPWSVWKHSTSAAFGCRSHGDHS